MLYTQCGWHMQMMFCVCESERGPCKGLDSGEALRGWKCSVLPAPVCAVCPCAGKLLVQVWCMYTRISALLNFITWKQGITLSLLCFARALWRYWKWRAGRKCGACNTLIIHTRTYTADHSTDSVCLFQSGLRTGLWCVCLCVWISRVLLSLV